jgi:hypothetical protein
MALRITFSMARRSTDEHAMPIPMLQSEYITGYTEEPSVSTTPQKRALNRSRKRLNQRGMVRFEVLGLDADRELIRSLARRLAANGLDSARLRDTVRLTISGEQPKKGGILNALRRSPLVGADLDFSRLPTPGRPVDSEPEPPRHQYHQQRNQANAIGSASRVDRGSNPTTICLSLR